MITMSAERINRADLAMMLESLRAAAVSAGITEASRWQLDIGSKTYGHAYRLWLRSSDPEKTGHYTPAVRDFLGMTARDAFHTMATLRDAFWAVSYVQKYGERGV